MKAKSLIFLSQLFSDFFNFAILPASNIINNGANKVWLQTLCDPPKNSFRELNKTHSGKFRTIVWINRSKSGTIAPKEIKKNNLGFDDNSFRVDFDEKV